MNVYMISCVDVVYTHIICYVLMADMMTFWVKLLIHLKRE